jgi:phosphoglycolate phosphatase
MNSSLPNCLIFDLDGTLIDSLPGIEFSVREAFIIRQVPLLHCNLRKLIGPPIRTILSEAGGIENDQILDDLEGAFRRSYDDQGWRLTACFTGVEIVLRIMADRGHRLFVATNKPNRISIKILDTLKIYDLFESVITRDSISPPYSSKSEMLRALLNNCQIPPEDCTMVGDTMEDCLAANEFGIKFAFMRHGYGEIDDGSSVPVDCKLDSFLQFLPLIAKEFAHD